MVELGVGVADVGVVVVEAGVVEVGVVVVEVLTLVVVYVVVPLGDLQADGSEIDAIAAPPIARLTRFKNCRLENFVT